MIAYVHLFWLGTACYAVAIGLAIGGLVWLHRRGGLRRD